MQALLIGHSVELMLAVPDLLNQAGFEVDCLSTRRIVKNFTSLRYFFKVAKVRDLPAMAATLSRNQYDLVIIADDLSLRAILSSALSDEIKLALLPVSSTGDFSHLCSKIGLSLCLQKNSILSPDFFAAMDKEAVQRAAEKISFPFMLKGDFSRGGQQTYACASQSELSHVLEHFNAYPALVQKKIVGEEIAVEAFYQKGALIYFTYSRVLKTVGNMKFAPSKLREYTQGGALDAAVFDELQKLGIALGADGYANISCIKSHDNQKRYYFEADMRPTAWIDFSKYFGDPPALRIKQYFASGQIYDRPKQCDPAYPEKIILPYFLRMKLWELVSNRYQVWRYMRWDAVSLYAFFKKMVR